jgi:hypothetical protein
MDRCSAFVTRVLGSAIVLAIFAAGCSGAGSTFSRPPVDTLGQMGEANSYAQTTQKLYIANAAGSVSVYSTGSNPTILQTISDGVPKPGGIWVDNGNNLYAVNLPGQSQQTSLPEYKPGANHPFRTITNGIVNCEYVAVDGQRNVYVAGMANNTFFLEIYPKGQLSPAQTLTIPHPTASRLSGLAFNSSGALLVGESIYLQKGVVYRLAPNSQHFTDLKLQDATGERSRSTVSETCTWDRAVRPAINGSRFIRRTLLGHLGRSNYKTNYWRSPLLPTARCTPRRAVTGRFRYQCTHRVAANRHNRSSSPEAAVGWR